MRIVPPVLLACLVLAPSAPAAVSPAAVDTPLACFSAASGTFEVTGYLRLEAGGDYRFDPDYPEERTAGAWDPSGAFTSGPLAGSAIADAPAGTTMPGDQKAGRTWPLVIEREGAVAAYCRTTRIYARSLFRSVERYVERVSGIEVALPRMFERASLSFNGDGEPLSTAFGQVRAAGSNFWRLDVAEGPCATGELCGRHAIISARRGPRSDIEVRFNRTLARGAVGWQGNVGCAFGSGIGWGPVYCGQTVIVWRYRGINYCIEGHAVDDRDLIRLANEAIRSLPTTASVRRW